MEIFENHSLGNHNHGGRQSLQSEREWQPGQHGWYKPSVVGEPNLSREERTLDRFFNTSAFAPNAPYTFGNAGRNILIGTGMVNFDLGLFKRFQVSEDKFFQFRFEAFNAFNTPQFGQPNAVVGNQDFGRIMSAEWPRNLQFGLKFIF